ncbi:MAG: hypothetical protein GXO42_01870 [bacterium]|nr:hypothetical protein [bacterium]
MLLAAYKTELALEYFLASTKYCENTDLQTMHEYLQHRLHRIREKATIIELLKRVELHVFDKELTAMFNEKAELLEQLISRAFLAALPARHCILCYWLIDLPLHYATYINNNEYIIIISITNNYKLVPCLAVHELLHLCLSLPWPLQALEAFLEWFAPYGKLCLRLGWTTPEMLEQRKQQLEELRTFKAYVLAPWFSAFACLEHYEFEEPVWQFLQREAKSPRIKELLARICASNH